HTAGRRQQIAFAYRTISDVDRGFSDAVHVDEQWLFVAVPFDPWSKTLQFERLAAKDDEPQSQRRSCGGGRATALLSPDQLAESRRSWIEDGNALFEQQREERFRLAADKIRNDHEPSAVKQRAPEFPN